MGQARRPKLPLKGVKQLEVADVLSLLFGQQVRKRQRRGRKKRHMQSVLQQQQRRGRPRLPPGISSRGAGPLLGKKAMTNGSSNVCCSHYFNP